MRENERNLFYAEKQCDRSYAAGSAGISTSRENTDRGLIMDRQNNGYRLGLYEKSMPSDLTWKEKLIIAKESGFDYLEMEHRRKRCETLPLGMG